jgi:hypothetical protein
MSRDRRQKAEMRRLEQAHPDPDRYAVDDETADRLLCGELKPNEATGPYARVAAVFAAAAAVPREAEIAGEEAAMAAFRAARRPAHGGVHRARPSRGRHLLIKLLGTKAAALALAGAASVGGVAAAATGSLPDPAQRIAHDVLGDVGVPAPDAEPADAAQQGSPTDAGAAGLCQAWSAGNGTDHGKRTDAAALERLVTAAGGPEKVADYCASLPDQPHQPDQTASSRSAHAEGTLIQQPTAQARGSAGSRPTAKPSADPDEVASLCRAWAQEQGSPAGQLDPSQRLRLAELAGGPNHVSDLCRAQAVNPGGSRLPVTTPTSTSAPTHPSGRP